MTDCPCGYGKGIPYNQRYCHICGTDLRLLHRWNQAAQDLWEAGEKAMREGRYEKAGVYAELAACLAGKEEMEEKKGMLRKEIRRGRRKVLWRRLGIVFSLTALLLLAAAGWQDYHLREARKGYERELAAWQERLEEAREEGREGEGFIHYRVRKGDTLYGLAYAFYGDGRLWRKIGRANQQLEPHSLKPGQVIVIPDLLGEEDKKPEGK